MKYTVSIVIVTAALLIGLSEISEFLKPSAPQVEAASPSTEIEEVTSIPEDPEPASELTPEPTLSHSEAVPASDEVDNSYFNDALFIGHSLMEGFELYSGITSASTATFCANTSASVVSTIKDSSGALNTALSQQTYGKIYIMLGINEVGGSASNFYTNYVALIDLVREYQPDAEIYLISITPTTSAKANTAFKNENVISFNASMLQVATDTNCWYLDLFSYFVGSDGYLPSSSSSDGVHFYRAQYGEMLSYLKVHTVP